MFWTQLNPFEPQKPHFQGPKKQRGSSKSSTKIFSMGPFPWMRKLCGIVSSQTSFTSDQTWACVAGTRARGKTDNFLYQLPQYLQHFQHSPSASVSPTPCPWCCSAPSPGRRGPWIGRFLTKRIWGLMLHLHWRKGSCQLRRKNWTSRRRRFATFSLGSPRYWVYIPYLSLSLITTTFTPIIKVPIPTSLKSLRLRLNEEFIRLLDLAEKEVRNF